MTNQILHQESYKYDITLAVNIGLKDKEEYQVCNWVYGQIINFENKVEEKRKRWKNRKSKRDLLVVLRKEIIFVAALPNYQLVDDFTTSMNSLQEELDQLEAVENELDEEEEEEEDSKDEEENKQKTNEDQNEEGKDEEGNDKSNDHCIKPRIGSQKYPADILKLATSVRNMHKNVKCWQQKTLDAKFASETSSMVFCERQSAASFLLPEICFTCG